MDVPCGIVDSDSDQDIPHSTRSTQHEPSLNYFPVPYAHPIYNRDPLLGRWQSEKRNRKNPVSISEKLEIHLQNLDRIGEQSRKAQLEINSAISSIKILEQELVMRDELILRLKMSLEEARSTANYFSIGKGCHRRVLILIDILRKWIRLKHYNPSCFEIPKKLIEISEEEGVVRLLANNEFPFPLQARATVKEYCNCQRSVQLRRILEILDKLKKVALQELFTYNIDRLTKLSNGETLFGCIHCWDFPSMKDVNGLEDVLPPGFDLEKLLRNYGKNDKSTSSSSIIGPIPLPDHIHKGDPENIVENLLNPSYVSPMVSHFPLEFEKQAEESEKINIMRQRKADLSRQAYMRKLFHQRKVLIIIDILRKWIRLKWEHDNSDRNDPFEMPAELFNISEEEQRVHRVANSTAIRGEDKKNPVNESRKRTIDRAKKTIEILKQLREVAQTNLYGDNIDDLMKLSDEEQALSIQKSRSCEPFPSLKDVEGLEEALPPGFDKQMILSKYGNNGNNCVVECLSKYDRPKRGRPEKHVYNVLESDPTSMMDT